MAQCLRTDDADNPHYIETLAWRGYRFVAPVAQAGGAPQEAGEAAAVSAATAAAEAASGSTLDSTVVARRRVWPWVFVATAATLALVGAMVWRGRHASPRVVTNNASRRTRRKFP